MAKGSRTGRVARAGTRRGAVSPGSKGAAKAKGPAKSKGPAGKGAPPPSRGKWAKPVDRGATIGGLQGLIRERYHATDSARGVPGTFMWFIEEVGELATALHENAPGKSPTDEQRANLEEEFADVLAWLMTLANIAGADGRGVDLERALRKYTSEGGVEGVKD